MSDELTDAIVAGAGPAGLAAAAALAQAGQRVTLIAPEAEGAGADPRTVALMRPSIRFIEHLGVWTDALKQQAAPLWRLRLIDDTGYLFSAAPQSFDAHGQGEPFGWNIPLALLVPALKARCRDLGVVRIAAEASHTELRGDTVLLHAGGHPALPARVVLAADGSRSAIRQACGLETVGTRYDQVALVTNFAHSAPHQSTSIEYHKQDGPLTTVPMPGDRSSLVWMMRPDRADTVSALDERRFCRLLQAETHGDLGVIGDPAPRATFPMRTLTAQAFARDRVMLVGEAGHVAPPIGAQGLNMSLRDAALAAELIADAAGWGDDPGGRQVMERYDTARRRDVGVRQAVVDTMNRTLLSRWSIVHAARSASITLASGSAFLRHKVIEAGTGEDLALPRAMR